jgi:hypothetical protein
MSDEQENTGGSIKNIVLGLISTITLGVGTWVTTQLTGGEEETKTEVAAPAPVINITNSNQQQQQQAAGGKTVIIKEKSVPAQQTTQNAQPAKPVVSKKEKEEEQAQW